jgi:translation elongation factor EF-G
MNLEVTVTRDHLSPVLADLAQRRGNIQEIQTRQDNRVVIGFVPLAEIMVGTLQMKCTYSFLMQEIFQVKIGGH